MEPKLHLDDLLIEDTIAISNPGAASGTISTGYGAKETTYTLASNALWANTTVANGGYSTNASPYTVTGSYSYPNVTIGAGTGITSPWSPTGLSSKIKLDGEGADIEVNGWSLIDAIKKIEERLNILTPNEKLEAEWEELWALGNQYRELEQHIKDKQATWDRLKAMPPPEVK